MARRLYKNVALFIAFFVNAVNIYSHTAQPPYEIATWQDFKQAAVSYTLDDHCKNQFEVAIPLFDEYGFKLTLYPVINWEPDWDKIKSAAANGHEIGSHTLSHPYLDTLPVEQQEKELKNAKTAINGKLNLSGIDCNTIAYPFCHAGDSAAVSRYYIAGRICSQEIEPKTPADYYHISSIVCGDQGAVNSLSGFVEKFSAAAASNGWCVLLIHGIDDDGGYSPIASETLRQSIEYLDKNRDMYWVATFRDVVLYSKERDAVSIVETQNTDNEIICEITDGLDNSVYNFPLTFRRLLPDAWSNAIVKQNNEIVSSKILRLNQANYIQFDVAPDNGVLSIISIKK
jgi:oligosaccharide reducing-end xylanase